MTLSCSRVSFLAPYFIEMQRKSFLNLLNILKKGLKITCGNTPMKLMELPRMNFIFKIYFYI